MISLPAINRALLLRQSLFALPWILASVLFSHSLVSHALVSFESLFWVVLAFFTARGTGMAFNRLIDEAIDAKNPRTASRPLQKGEISRGALEVTAFSMVALFFFAVWHINPFVFLLSPFVLTLVVAYSYMKRLTIACHFVLGLVQFFGPLLTFVAITGEVSTPALLFSSALGMLIAANDILYACLDIEFDRKEGLYSVPARYGIRIAKRIALLMHIITIGLLVGFGVTHGASLIYYAACLAIAGMLRETHRAFAKHTDFAEKIFSLSNTYIGVAVLLGALLERVWRVM
jgi:4-hydroxybenzoate polyprenyltransferase